MKVIKFGGSSIGTPARAKAVVLLIADRVAKGETISAVVFSAFEGCTNELIAIGDLAMRGGVDWVSRFAAVRERHLAYLKELLPPIEQSVVAVPVSLLLNQVEDLFEGAALTREISPRLRDHMLSFGEQLSTTILAAAIKHHGVGCRYVDAREILVTDSHFGDAKVARDQSYARIQELAKRSVGMMVVTGFIGATIEGMTTTLGRGGSDYTASLFAAALQAEEVEIWTDVDGMMTADPRKVSAALILEEIAYEEALELCHFGAKVVYAPTLQPAMERKIPIRVRNTFRPEVPGTVIKAQATPHPYPISGVSSIANVSLLLLQGSGLIGMVGASARFLEALSDAEVNTILISQASSEHSICIAIASADADRALRAVMEEFSIEVAHGLLDSPKLTRDLSIISIVGRNMRGTPGVAARFFQNLAKNGVNISALAQGSSELSISAVIQSTHEKKAVVAAHEAFFTSEMRTINVFLAGTGLIGSTLLAQIAAHRNELREQEFLDVRVVGLTSTKRMVLSNEGLNLALWKEVPQEQKSGARELLHALRRFNLPNSVFVDCTASDEVAALYRELLESNIPVITSNKRAQSGAYDQYAQLRALSRKRGVEFLFETSVGAGLPVINTLNDLRKSGDKVLSIEAVLSGTLSFIFNTFARTEHPFSEIVRMAKEKGYTEPDPRDDLNGLDAARKILILAREAGIPLEMSDITIEPLLSSELFKAPSVEKFFALLPGADATMEEKRLAAKNRGNALAYVAKVADGRAALALQEISPAHAFYGLSGADNIISFTTERYKERPLVVKGPGAGAEVTAAGVFADIVRIANSAR